MLSWRAELTDRAGFCQFLQVEAYGFAFASVARCDGGEAQDLGRCWLTDSKVQALDAWRFGKSPLDLPHVNLFSRGTQQMGETEVSALRAWANALYLRLSEA
jgi:hypothetical protein